ncbi:MAG: 30S ribosomal protein S5 alanine N-acetyltransferase, partial [Paracoccaceae bacterium]
MIFKRREQVRIETARMTLRLPRSGDFAAWTGLRRESAAFLKPWEPVWSRDHLTKKSFSTRVYSASRAVEAGTGLPLF